MAETYTIHETIGGQSVAISYPYTGALHGAKLRAILDRAWEGSTLTITIDEHKIAVHGKDGWCDPRDCAA